MTTTIPPRLLAAESLLQDALTMLTCQVLPKQGHEHALQMLIISLLQFVGEDDV